ncbi:protein chibby homolog 2 [Patagioenas fasciata]|uniref:Spermatid-associated protein n=1 Tax=Patagioenas fasciata monilis TaxID=372326 RepID=A0A1V4J4N3_PATFA|nr:spermatid-associated protein [Patagioenas fasciata monilis]
MSAFDLENENMQSTEPEIEYITPRMKCRDEMFTFVDGRGVNEIYCQPPIASHRKFFSKKVQDDWSIWEENRALWEENQVLRIENRMLWEENNTLQCFQPQNRAVQVIYTDAIQQSLQKENKPFPFFQERNIGFQVSPGNKVLQVVQEKRRVLEDFQKENKTVPIIWKDQESITVHEECKDATSDLQKDTDDTIAVEEDNPDPASKQEHEAKSKSTTPSQDTFKSCSSMQSESEILQALQDLYELLHIFLKVNPLLGEKQGHCNLYDVRRSFQEDYNKLKMQLNAVKNAVSDIRAQMQILEKELIAITSALYE